MIVITCHYIHVLGNTGIPSTTGSLEIYLIRSQILQGGGGGGGGSTLYI